MFIYFCFVSFFVGYVLVINIFFKIVPESTEPPDRVRKENGDIEYKRDLIVSSLRELEDNGMYQCVATNSYGETSGAAVLIITPSHKEGKFCLGERNYFLCLFLCYFLANFFEIIFYFFLKNIFTFFYFEK